MKKQAKSPAGKSRRPLLTLLIVLLIIGAACAGLWHWQKNNIEALLMFTRHSKEELEDQLQENDLRFQQMLEEALANAGKVDLEQLPPPAQPITEEEAELPPEDTAETAAQQPVQTEPTYQQLLQAIVDRAYALKNEYVGALDTMEKEAVAAYRAMPAEQRTKKALVDFASTYISKATNLEKDCDKKMDQIISDLDALQKRFGQSNDLVEQVKYTYANEKKLKKAWYMAELESRGMV